MSQGSSQLSSGRPQDFRGVCLPGNSFPGMAGGWPVAGHVGKIFSDKDTVFQLFPPSSLLLIRLLQVCPSEMLFNKS